MGYKKVQFVHWLYRQLPSLDLPPLEERLLMYLTHLCGTSPVCYPGRSDLKQVLGVSSLKYVSTLLRRLARRELIVIRPRKKQGTGPGRPNNEYYIKVYEEWTKPTVIKSTNEWTKLKWIKSTGGTPFGPPVMDFNQVDTNYMNQKEPEIAGCCAPPQEVSMGNIGKGDGKGKVHVVADPEPFEKAVMKVEELKESAGSPEEVLADFRGKQGYGVDMVKGGGHAVAFYVQLRASVKKGFAHSLGMSEKKYLSAIWKFFQQPVPDDPECPLFILYHICVGWPYFRQAVVNKDKTKKVPHTPDLKFLFYNKELALEFGVKRWQNAELESVQSIAKEGNTKYDFN